MNEEEITNFEEKLEIPLKLKCLYNIAQLDKKKEYSYSDLERQLGFNKPRWDVRELFDYLVAKSFLIFCKKTLGVSFYKLDIKAIKKYLINHSSFSIFEGLAKSETLYFSPK